MLDKDHSLQPGASTYSVPAVVRAIKVLRYVAAGRPVLNLSQAARDLGINRTTLLRLLHTLEAEHFIERAPDADEYVLGPELIELAAQKIYALDVAQVAKPILDRLARSLGLACYLGVRDGYDVVYVLRCAPHVHLVSNVQVGTRLPAHASTMGRAMLAHMPPDQLDELYAGVTLSAVTDKTPTTLAALHRQLADVRAASIADGRSSYEIGIDSIAAPVFDFTAHTIAAINVSGPERAFSEPPGRREQLAREVRQAAAEISRRLGGPIAGPANTRSNLDRRRCHGFGAG